MVETGIKLNNEDFIYGLYSKVLYLTYFYDIYHFTFGKKNNVDINVCVLIRIVTNNYLLLYD